MKITIEQQNGHIWNVHIIFDNGDGVACFNATPEQLTQWLRQYGILFEIFDEDATDA